MYFYRKPKNAEHASELVNIANVNVPWNICDSNNPELAQKYFELYQPIIFIYKNNNLVVLADGVTGKPRICDIYDRDVTMEYNKSQLQEIHAALNQLELF